MPVIQIKDVTKKNMEDLCMVCVPPEKREEPDFLKGIEDKQQWIDSKLQEWGSFAKLAYIDNNEAGILQYQPLAAEKAVMIECIFVLREDYWRKGVATKLLSSLIADMKKPHSWFDNEYPLALVTRTFPGELKGQLSAREFFKKKGFKQIGDAPDYLYFPLVDNFVYEPKEEKKEGYVLQEEDEGKVIIPCGPNSCSFTYPYFLKRMEKYIREIDSNIPIRWLDVYKEPEEAKKRNIDVLQCIVNGKHIKTFVLEKEGFQKEVREALGK